MKKFVYVCLVAFVLSPLPGYCGQVFKTEILRQNAIPLVTVTYANITSLLLPAGDYDCRGNVGFTAPTTATLLTHIKGNISLVSASASLGSAAGESVMEAAPETDGSIWAVPTGTVHVPLSVQSTVYLVGKAYFENGPESGFGFLECRSFP